MTNPQSKGARGELQVRDLCRVWWGVLEPGCQFTRTPRSGGWHGAGEYDMAGDLMTTAKLFPFCVEVKWREAWSIRMVWRGMRSPVWGWWSQACRDAQKTEPHRVPILWFRKRSVQWFVMLPMTYVDNTERVLEPDCVVYPPPSSGSQGAVAIYTAARFLRHDPSVFARASDGR